VEEEGSEAVFGACSVAIEEDCTERRVRVMSRG